MKTSAFLQKFFRLVMDEAENNPRFGDAIAELVLQASGGAARSGRIRIDSDTTRSKSRRSAPVLDPLEVAKSGPAELRLALQGLSLDQLRDIVSEYGMDPTKLVVKWVSEERVIDRIVTTSLNRLKKGDAFRAEENSMMANEADTDGMDARRLKGAAPKGGGLVASFHEQECPLCSAAAEYCWVDYRNRKYFKCESCGYFQISKTAEKKLLGKADLFRKECSRLAKSAQSDEMLFVALASHEQRSLNPTEELSVSVVKKSEMPLNCE